MLRADLVLTGLKKRKREKIRFVYTTVIPTRAHFFVRSYGENIPRKNGTGA